MSILTKLSAESRALKLAKQAEKEKGKEKVCALQVQVPAEMHEEVSKVLAKLGITWKQLILSYLEQVLEESKK